MTLEPLKDPPREMNQVVLDLGEGRQETYSKNYLLAWIKGSVAAGERLTNIRVTPMLPNNGQKKPLLTADVWMISLLRGPHKKEFQEIWEAGMIMEINHSDYLDNLRRLPQFETRAKMFIRDLYLFNRHKGAKKRLKATNHEFYLGQPYFDEKMVDRMLGLPIGNGTLESRLKDIQQRKVDDDEEIEICTLCELAPLVQKGLRIRWCDIENEQDFIDEFAGLNFGTGSSGTWKEKSKTFREKSSRFFKRSGKENEKTEKDRGKSPIARIIISLSSVCDKI